MFKLGRGSLKELEGVHPDLIAVVKRAIELTIVDFGVHDGLRTKKEQDEYVRTGVAKTRNSKHLIQADGFGHAVDLVPYVNNKLRWEWPPIYHIAAAVHQAAEEQGIGLIWGGVWDRRLNDLDSTAVDLEDERRLYAARVRAQGRRPFLDGPHYQLA